MIWFASSCFFLCFLCLILYINYRDLQGHVKYLQFLHEIELQKNILDDLELATSDQLIYELRSRGSQGSPCLVLYHSQGGTMLQSCNMTVQERVEMLSAALEMAKNERKNNFFGS